MCESTPTGCEYVTKTSRNTQVSEQGDLGRTAVALDWNGIVTSEWKLFQLCLDKGKAFFFCSPAWQHACSSRLYSRSKHGSQQTGTQPPLQVGEQPSWHVDGMTLQPHRLPLVSGITSCLPRHLIYIPLEFLFLLNNNKQPRTVIAFVGRGHEGAFLGVGNVLCFVLSGGHTGVCTLKNVLSCTPNICTLYVNYSLIFLKKIEV